MPHLRRASANSIAFTTYRADIRKVLEHIGAETEPLRITLAHGPPLLNEYDP